MHVSLYMSWTTTDIQVQIASEIDGNATISSSSTDWAYRLAPINRALFDWAETYDWRQLKKIFNGIISTSTGNASVALPSDFRRMDGAPLIAWSNSSDNVFPIVDPTKNVLCTDSDNFVNIIGNDRDSNVMYVHSSTLPSGASVQFTYYAFPVSLASTGQLTECPDPTFIVQKALYYIYKSREDGRFPEAKAEADKILARMIENENTLGRGYVDRNVHSTPMNTFRYGRD